MVKNILPDYSRVKRGGVVYIARKNVEHIPELFMKFTPYFLLILFCASIVQAQNIKTVDTLLVMSDGKKLDAVYVYPDTPPPPTGYPSLVIVHGFGGSKEKAQAQNYARQGYFSVAYSVRGQGASEGVFDFFTSPRIRGDLQQVIDFTKGMTGVNTDRLGVVGGSQGGIHAWAAAAFNMGVRCVVSIVANGRFEEDFTQNNSINWLFSFTIQNSGSRVRFAPVITDTIIPALRNDNFAIINELALSSSTKHLETSVTTPTMILVSYYDEYFNPTAALRQFNRIPAPKKIMLWAAGHGASKDASISASVNLAAAQWLEYWLKDNQSLASIASPDGAVVMFDQATLKAVNYALKDSAKWLAPPSQLPPDMLKKRFYFSQNGFDVASSSTDGQKVCSFVLGTGTTPTTFRTAPFAEDTRLAGCIGSASFVANSNAAKYQMNLHLFDVDPSKGTSLPLTKGHYEIRGNDPAVRDQITYELQSVAHTIKTGHVIEARLTGGVGLLPKAEEFGNITTPPSMNGSDSLFFGPNQSAYIDLYFIDPFATSVRTPNAPSTLSLEQNYPNPFTEQTSIRFRVNANAEHSPVTLKIVNNLGQVVSTLLQEQLAPGMYEALFRSTDLPQGMYRFVLENGVERISKSMVLVR